VLLQSSQLAKTQEILDIKKQMHDKLMMSEAKRMSDTILNRLHDKTAKYNLALRHVM
jgi:hypothetical protein